MFISFSYSVKISKQLFCINKWNLYKRIFMYAFFLLNKILYIFELSSLCILTHIHTRAPARTHAHTHLHLAPFWQTGLWWSLKHNAPSLQLLPLKPLKQSHQKDLREEELHDFSIFENLATPSKLQRENMMIYTSIKSVLLIELCQTCPIP